MGLASANTLPAMIRIPLPWLVFTGLLIFLAGIYFVWICYEIARRIQEATRRRHCIRCRLCSYEFHGTPESQLPRCPQCGTPNERFRPKFF